MQPLYNIVASNAFPTLSALYIFALRVGVAHTPSPSAKGVRCGLNYYNNGRYDNAGLRSSTEVEQKQ